MTAIKRWKLEDVVWLFNHQSGEKQLAIRRPAQLVEEGYLSGLSYLLAEEHFAEPEEDEEPIDSRENPYEVVELTKEDVIALDPTLDDLWHAGSTPDDEYQYAGLDAEFGDWLMESLNDYAPTEQEKAEMEEHIDRSNLVELIEVFSRSTDTVVYAYAAETVDEGLWGATLRATRTKEEALEAWRQWLDDADWYSLVS